MNRAIAATDGKALRNIADKLLKLAEDGEPWAVQLLADRLDGKPKQQVEHSGDNANPVVLATRPLLTAEEWLAAHDLGPTTRTTD